MSDEMSDDNNILDDELQKKIYDIVASGEFAKIPDDELREDLIDAEEDLIICETSVKLGIKYGKIDMKRRINENKKQITIINMELNRRAGKLQEIVK